MAEIEKIYEDAARTTQIYPQTHEKAVVDNNGTTLESKLGIMEGVIQQKQMAIGAVPSDITPTKNSTNWPTSGGVFNAIDNLSKSTALNSTFEVSEEGVFFADKDLNVGMKYDDGGLDVGKISDHFASLLESVGVIVEVSEKGMYVVDSSLNIGAVVNNTGIHSVNVVEFDMFNN